MQYYNVAAGDRTLRIAVRRSEQHISYERVLHVSSATMRKILAAGDGPWYCAPPTPFAPRAIFREVPR
jgi:hypothetical protein